MFLFLRKRNKKGRQKNRTKQVFSIYLRTGIKFLAPITQISHFLAESFGTSGITKNTLLVYSKDNPSPQQHKLKKESQILMAQLSYEDNTSRVCQCVQGEGERIDNFENEFNTMRTLKTFNHFVTSNLLFLHHTFMPFFLPNLARPLRHSISLVHSSSKSSKWCFNWYSCDH